MNIRSWAVSIVGSLAILFAAAVGQETAPRVSGDGWKLTDEAFQDATVSSIQNPSSHQAQMSQGNGWLPTEFGGGSEEKPSFPKTKVTGFFHLDGAYFSQDRNNRLTLGDIEDGLAFRRARLAAAGEVARDVSFIIEFDIAQSQARFVDVWMQLDTTNFNNSVASVGIKPRGLGIHNDFTHWRSAP